MKACAFSNGPRSAIKWLGAKMLAAVVAICFRTLLPVRAQASPVTNGSPTLAQQARAFEETTEKIRADCIRGRREVCGRIVEILPDGLVVDSGYASLMRPPLEKSWLIPGTVQATREAALVEGNEPGCMCVGLVCVTTLPKSRSAKPKLYDYVLLEVYPVGLYTYTSVGSIHRTVRRFSANLPVAVSMNRAAVGLQLPEFASGDNLKAASIPAPQDNSAFATQTNTIVTTQEDAAARATIAQQLSELRLGPFSWHPRLTAGWTYDNNILYAVANKEADQIWMFQPALQAVAGDDAALLSYRDRHEDIFSLAPGNLIFQPPDDRPGRFLVLDYAPRFQVFDKYTANNSIDQFATFDLLWSMDKLILGFKQDYQLQKEAIIEAGERTTVESIPTTISAAYQFGDKTSVESDFRRVSTGYATPGLIGYTEYNTEDWFNYKLEEDFPVSVGVLTGVEEVANHQDQTFEQLRARARYLYTEKLTFDVSLGGELRQYEDGHHATLNPVFNIAGQYRLAERTWLRLSGYRQFYAAIFNGYNYSSTGATLEVRQGITDRFTASVSAGYFSVEYTTVGGPLTTHTDNYFNVRFSLEAKIVSHLTGQIFCQWISRQSQFNGDLQDDQAGVQLTLGF